MNATVQMDSFAQAAYDILKDQFSYVYVGDAPPATPPVRVGAAYIEATPQVDAIDEAYEADVVLIGEEVQRYFNENPDYRDVDHLNDKIEDLVYRSRWTRTPTSSYLVLACSANEHAYTERYDYEMDGFSPVSWAEAAMRADVEDWIAANTNINRNLENLGYDDEEGDEDDDEDEDDDSSDDSDNSSDDDSSDDSEDDEDDGDDDDGDDDDEE